jgi:cytoskeletal protein CcmA (bactofilin family)
MERNHNLDGHLGQGIEIKGTLRFEGSVRIDGKFVGKVISPATLIVGPTAVVDGEVEVGEIEVHGALRGQVKASQRATIHGTGRVDADLDTLSLVIEPGAHFNGRCEMRKKDEPKPAAAPAPSAPIAGGPTKPAPGANPGANAPGQATPSGKS